MESLDPDELNAIRLNLFGMELDTTGLTRLRLGEHAVHTWDVAVALDSAATVSAEAVSLLIDTLNPLAGRSGKPAGQSFAVHVITTEPARDFIIESNDAVRLTAAQPHELPRNDVPRLQLPAEAFVRLVYGRLDPQHTPPVVATDVDLDDLRRMFPGF